MFGFLDPMLLSPPEERLYAEDCRLFPVEDPYRALRALLDEFFVAHALGYWVKMIVLRDGWLVFAVSLGFEVLECTFQYWLPNFKECWWDHLLLDVFGCNALGMVLGYYTLRYLNAREYNWVKLGEVKGLGKKARRIALQFTPRSWHIQQWAFFNSPAHTLDVTFVLFVFLLQESNCFFAKHILWMPSTHPLVVGRVVMWGFLALPSIREFYCYRRESTGKKNRRLGTTAWVCSLALFFETLVILKYARQGNYFAENPLPHHVKFMWSVALVSWIIWFVVRYWRFWQCGTHSITRRVCCWILYGIPFVALAMLCAIATPGIEPISDPCKIFVGYLSGVPVLH